MNRIRKRISKDLKNQILSESLVSGCVLSELADSYGIEVKRIYGWRSKYKKKQQQHKELETIAESANEFIELSLPYKKSSILQRAELIFSDFSINIEGNIATSKLLNIVTILESEG